MFFCSIVFEPLALKRHFLQEHKKKRRHDHHDNNITVKMLYNYKVIFPRRLCLKHIQRTNNYHYFYHEFYFYDIIKAMR